MADDRDRRDTDHDRLIRIDETTQSLQADVERVEKKVDCLDGKVANLRIESSAAVEKFRSYSKSVAWLWAVILAIITGGAAALVAIARGGLRSP
ncbi:MAG: hypothetical protein A2V88_00725 [Elusimicrobia bacterium RBG_16_66_12]|nr:MAG: hypothetical protein A2V88_00725 [Elusimicrobia bacterium RBG_16_66_12]